MVESPCKKICKIDKKNGFCHGRLRTQQEINNWIMLSERKKKEIIFSLKNRSQILKKLTK